MKKNKKLWATGIIIVLIGILVAAGNFYYTKDRQINRIDNEFTQSKNWNGKIRNSFNARYERHR